MRVKIPSCFPGSWSSDQIKRNVLDNVYKPTVVPPNIQHVVKPNPHTGICPVHLLPRSSRNHQSNSNSKVVNFPLAPRRIVVLSTFISGFEFILNHYLQYYIIGNPITPCTLEQCLSQQVHPDIFKIMSFLGSDYEFLLVHKGPIIEVVGHGLDWSATIKAALKLAINNNNNITHGGFDQDRAIAAVDRSTIRLVDINIPTTQPYPHYGYSLLLQDYRDYLIINNNRGIPNREFGYNVPQVDNKTYQQVLEQYAVTIAFAKFIRDSLQLIIFDFDGTICPGTGGSALPSRIDELARQISANFIQALAYLLPKYPHLKFGIATRNENDFNGQILRLGPVLAGEPMIHAIFESYIRQHPELPNNVKKCLMEMPIVAHDPQVQRHRNDKWSPMMKKYWSHDDKNAHLMVLMNHYRSNQALLVDDNVDNVLSAAYNLDIPSILCSDVNGGCVASLL